jgi:hypothetical protein
MGAYEFHYSALSVSMWDGNHMCGITTVGDVQCWRTDDSFSNEPLDLGVDRTAVAISASGSHWNGEHTCAILDDGSISCWGRNFGNMYGDGSSTDIEIPTLTHIEEGAVYISAGDGAICVIMVDDSLYCW